MDCKRPYCQVEESCLAKLLTLFETQDKLATNKLKQCSRIEGAAVCLVP